MYADAKRMLGTLAAIPAGGASDIAVLTQSPAQPMTNCFRAASP